MKEKKPNFFENVYEVVKLIPKGRVTSYGAIATYLGAKGSARMVGWALIAAHPITDVPAYRVVNRNGLLTGKQHFGAPDAMKNYLENEGIKIEQDQIIDFKQVFWDPNLELL